jgi:hypothetical protein
MKVKCCYCGQEVNAFDLATVDIKGKRKYCHTDCFFEHHTKLKNLLKEGDRLK